MNRKGTSKHRKYFLATLDSKIWMDGSGQGNAKGNLEYSSIITKRYLFLDEEFFGPTKSTNTRSKGLVDCTNVNLRGS